MHRPNSAKPISATSGNTRMWRITERNHYEIEVEILGDVGDTF